MSDESFKIIRQDGSTTEVKLTSLTGTYVIDEEPELDVFYGPGVLEVTWKAPKPIDKRPYYRQFDKQHKVTKK